MRPAPIGQQIDSFLFLLSVASEVMGQVYQQGIKLPIVHAMQSIMDQQRYYAGHSVPLSQLEQMHGHIISRLEGHQTNLNAANLIIQNIMPTLEQATENLRLDQLSDQDRKNLNSYLKGESSTQGSTINPDGPDMLTLQTDASLFKRTNEQFDQVAKQLYLAWYLGNLPKQPLDALAAKCSVIISYLQDHVDYAGAIKSV